MDNPALSFSLKCDADADANAILPAKDLSKALFKLRRNATDLQREGGDLATFRPEEFPVCEGETCVWLHDTPNAGQAWTVEGVLDVVQKIESKVANHQDKADWVACGFGVNAKGASGVDFATGCFVKRGREVLVQYCQGPPAAI